MGESEQSFSTNLDAGRLSLASDSDSAAVPDMGATANLARRRRLEHHNRTLGQKGYRKVSPYPSSARLRFGDGRLSEVRQAADISVGIAGSKANFNALVLDTDIPALLRVAP